MSAIWKGYVIRKTYQEGKHKGESYIYIRGGYVKLDSKHTFILKDQCYSTLSSVKGVITRIYKQQDQVFSQRNSYEVVEVENGHLVYDEQNR